MEKSIDFGNISFFERLSLSAREPVYSAALAWLLDDQSPLPLRQRLEIIAALCGIYPSGCRAIYATTEWNDVDLLLRIERDQEPLFVAIENKIKSVEGKNQLTVYDRHLDRLPGSVRKVFLTLTGEAPRSGHGWASASYADLLAALRAHSSQDNVYLRDLCEAMARLVAVTDAVGTDGDEDGAAAMAFHDRDAPPATQITSYIDHMRLKNVVQRAWMTALGAKLEVTPPWQLTIGETRGQALLDMAALLDDHPGYLVGLQLQGRTLKAFCLPYPYPKRASDDQHQAVEMILEQIRSALKLGDRAKPSSRRIRGFRSFSVATMPRGRKHEVWVPHLRPHIERFVASFIGVHADS